VLKIRQMTKRAGLFVSSYKNPGKTTMYWASSFPQYDTGNYVGIRYGPEKICAGKRDGSSPMQPPLICGFLLVPWHLETRPLHTLHLLGSASHWSHGSIRGDVRCPSLMTRNQAFPKQHQPSNSPLLHETNLHQAAQNRAFLYTILPTSNTLRYINQL